MGVIIPVDLWVYDDRTSPSSSRSPPASRLILKALGIEKGSQDPIQKAAFSTRAGQGHRPRKMQDRMPAERGR